MTHADIIHYRLRAERADGTREAISCAFRGTPGGCAAAMADLLAAPERWDTLTWRGTSPGSDCYADVLPLADVVSIYLTSESANRDYYAPEDPEALDLAAISRWPKTGAWGLFLLAGNAS